LISEYRGQAEGRLLPLSLVFSTKSCLFSLWAVFRERYPDDGCRFQQFQRNTGAVEAGTTLSDGYGYSLPIAIGLWWEGA
jgi:hypothetical protein